MIEITCNDRYFYSSIKMRLGKKVRVKCKYHFTSTYTSSPEDTIGELKLLIAAQTGTKADKIVLKKWYTIYKDHISLQDCNFIFVIF